MGSGTPGGRGVQAFGVAVRSGAESQRRLGSPFACHPRPGIWVAEWLQPAADGGLGKRDFAANQWWAHVDSNHGPLPYQGVPGACRDRTKVTHLVTCSPKNCGDLQRNPGARFPRRPNKANRGPGIWVAE